MRDGIIVIGALLLSANAWASDDYQCTIQRVVAATEPSAYSSMVGKQFTVERQSGLMAGALKNSYFTQPQIIDPGSTENSYKVVTTMRTDQGAGAGSTVFALIINEYDDGPHKQFVFMVDSDVFFGLCQHF